MRKQRLEHFQRTLMTLRDRLTSSVDHVIESIQEDMNPQGNLSTSPVHLADIASEGIEADVHVLDAERGMLGEVEAALARIQNGQFGVCQDCGKPIAEERLQALPYAAKCIACARTADAESLKFAQEGASDRYSRDEEAASELGEETAATDAEADGFAAEVPIDELSEADRALDAEKPKRRRRRAGQRRDELLPGEVNEDSSGDRLAAGTAGGGLASGGLAGTNRGDGSTDDVALDDAMGSGQYDNTAADEMDEEFENGVGFGVENPEAMIAENEDGSLPTKPK